MKKIVPLKGYALITFESDGEFKLAADSLQNEKNGLVIEMGVFKNDPGFKEGDRIYFTQITGRVIINENGSYAFINYSDVIGKELK